MNRIAVSTVAASVAVAIGCSAPATLKELEQAERLEKDGENEQALASYDRAIETCKARSNPRLRARDCRAAHLHRAELLVTMEKTADAVRAYEAIEVALPDDRTARAEGVYRAGRLRLRNGDEVGGYKQLWRVVTDYPDEQFAGDALKVVVTDGRARNAEQLYTVLRDLLAALEKTAVGDNVLFHLAELAENERADLASARLHYDRIWRDHQTSGLFDEALWRSASLSEKLGDPVGASERLRRLLDTREVALGAGSYFSVWLDDAQLKLGTILRDRLEDPAAARRVFEQLPRDYPASILRDDALHELAITIARSGDRESACRVYASLGREWPNSKFLLESSRDRSLAHCPAAPPSR